MNWLCRIIGHRWTMRINFDLDGLKYQRIVRFSHCTRCGEPWIPTDDTVYPMSESVLYEPQVVADMVVNDGTPSRPETTYSKGDNE